VFHLLHTPGQLCSLGKTFKPRGELKKYPLGKYFYIYFFLICIVVVVLRLLYFGEKPDIYLQKLEYLKKLVAYPVQTEWGLGRIFEPRQKVA
jgi:hypothetical protein